MLINICPFCGGNLAYRKTDEVCFEPGADRIENVLRIECAGCGAVGRAEGAYNIDIAQWTDKNGKRIFPCAKP